MEALVAIATVGILGELFNYWTTKRLSQRRRLPPVPKGLHEDDLDSTYVELSLGAHAHLDFWKFDTERGRYLYPVVVGKN